MNVESTCRSTACQAITRLTNTVKEPQKKSNSVVIKYNQRIQTDVVNRLLQNVTTITVSVTDVNDNRPEFSSSSFVGSVLLKDAEEGKLLLTLSATDRDSGNNSLITYRSVQLRTPPAATSTYFKFNF